VRLSRPGSIAVLAVAAAAAGCGGGEEAVPAASPSPPGTTTPAGEPDAESPATSGEEPKSGGVYRVDWEASFNFTDGFDPTGEYLGEVWGIYSSLLIRTLVGYRHTAGAAGNELIPGFAIDLGEISPDGLTYTFTLKDGIAFGPPLSRPITSRDIAYAFERIGTPSLVAQYAGYYQVIEGMAEFSDGNAKSVSGIETPDEETIRFRLTEPTGDFLYRLAMPAAGPIPEEVAGCFDEAGEYGRYVISSGPYMIDGSDALDPTSCATLEPIAGFDGDSALTFVRNPDYDPATDSRTRGRTSSTVSSGGSTRTTTTSTTASKPASSTTRSPRRRRPSSSATRRTRSSLRACIRTRATGRGTSR
jgi:peptide/nickel transport system substrate-binding protein